MQKNIGTFQNYFSIFALLANIALFSSTAIQVGFAYNLNVPTVPSNITMNAAEAYALPGLAARGWAAGACITMVIIGILGITNRMPRRTALMVIVMTEFLTLLPITFAFFTGKLPAGADWIFMHHCISGGLALIALLTTPEMNMNKVVQN